MRVGRRPFVGRDRELGALEAGLASALGGRGAVFVVAGEPGIGKTRLADELATHAKEQGARVLWGRCWETGPAPAYWPWVQVLRELGLEDALPAATEAAVSTPEVESARFRLHDTAFRALKDAAADRPLVIVLDDLHAADLGSLALLLFAARNVRTLKLLLLCTTREAETAARPELESLLHRVGREGTRLSLPRLSRDDVAQLMRELTSATVSEDAVSAVFQSTDGTPLYVDEAVRLFEAHGPDAMRQLPAEAAAREVLRAHLALLSAEARPALHAAAVIGRDFSTRLLSRALDTTEGTVAIFLSAAERARIVQPAGASTTGLYRFAHVLLQEALYDGLEPQARAHLHQRIAEALEKSPAEAPPGIAAHHALSALPWADTDWALALAARAADEARARLAFDAAADLHLRARKALPPEDTARQLDLMLQEAQARLHSGAAAEGRQLSLEAIALARRAGDAERLARAALALGAEFNIGQVSRELISVLEEAETGLKDPSGPVAQGLLAQLRARRAAALQPCTDPSGPVRMAHEALALARATGDAAVVQSTLYSACSAFGDYEEPDVRAPLNREFTGLALARGDRVLAHRGLTRLAVDLVELGRFAEVYGVLEELEALARSAGVPQLKWRVPLVRSMLAAIEGRYAACDALLEEARALGASLDDWNVRVVCAFHQLGLSVASERPLAAGLVDTALAMMPAPAEEALVYGTIVRSALVARTGEADPIRALLAKLPLSGPLSWATDPTVAFWLASAVRVAHLPEPARVLAVMLRRRRFEYCSWGAMGYVWSGPVAGLHGLLEATMGNLATAETLQTESLQKIRALEAVGHLPRALYELARTRLEMGDLEGALPLLDEALPLSESLGQTMLLPQLTALRGGRAEPKPAPMVAVPAAQFTLARQGESWAVTHGGKTFHLRDTRGLQMLETLLQSPGQDIHALDLSGGAEVGDSGELLDESARAQYRARAAELRVDLEEAEADGDLGRGGRIRSELEFLEDELSRAFGLSGRSRKSAQASERARVNVQRRIKDVLKKIEENDSILGQHLAWAVKTGTFCSYRKP